MRNIQCAKYENCLQKAALQDLPELACETCSRCNERAVEAGSLDDFLGCQALLTAVFVTSIRGLHALEALEKQGISCPGALLAIERANKRSQAARAEQAKRRAMRGTGERVEDGIH